MTRSAIACFSYLAAVHTLRVPRMPELNYGIEIISTGSFLAGDGPIVAGALAALGREPVLLTNTIGDDPQGQLITDRLGTWGVPTPLAAMATATMVNTVVCDEAGNRTWFSGLRGIDSILNDIDLSPLHRASAVYIDCYEVLGDAPRRVFDAACDLGVDIYLNLGGGPLPGWLRGPATTRARVVQTNASHTDPDAAGRLAVQLAQTAAADVAVVTAGHLGAFAVHHADDTVVHAPALKVAVKQVQGAGSVFSAALLDSLQSQPVLHDALTRACSAGSLWCSRTEDDPFPTSAEITATPTDRAS
ncbi:carbohydrate kinase family protein [Catellatospora sp. NPDC049111]|uniref:Carbohydrate kinase PfkB domain-containing protein n=1 Tax=Catellatospora coxensis TaxID=310354 RepID=A0A8J3KYE5_9ACTN|nr:carbohydrate kinase family protein [Catellatospora coxensis]GIG05694.1 hypothetical protein Cco03nite_23940 [Catellatospora coxensis]